MFEKDQVKIAVRVQPNSSRNELIGFREGVLHIKVAAPPVKGKANRELITFLSDILGISRTSMVIEKGMSSKRKLIRITGLTQNQFLECIRKE